jgi:riboflavin kinase/FMN adenylyltransferase
VSGRRGEEEYYGMMNIGVRPTVSTEGRETLEVHLFDFNGDLYGARLSVSFLRRLRDERRFESPEALAVQLARDREEARKTALRHQRTTRQERN